jgi:diguanylate cyclase (GGDEF)-like protein
MNRPDLKNTKDMLIEGIFSSSLVDSSGEVVDIKGMDISSFEEGKGVANWEHIGAAEGVGKEIIGAIVYAKKIFDFSDCETVSEKFFFRKNLEKPFLYGIVRLFDGAGHHEAQDLAAQLRDYEAHGQKYIIGFSVEGSTVTKESNVIKESIARKVALTVQPCNKAASTRILLDPNAPKGFDSIDRTDLAKNELLTDPLFKKLGGKIDLVYNPVVGSDRTDVSDALDNLVKNVATIRYLKKTLTTGNYDAAPSSLSQGAALQREDLGRVYKGSVLAAARDFDGPWDRKRFKKHLQDYLTKAQLPPMSDEFIDHFTNIAEDWKLKKSLTQDQKTALAILQKAFSLEEQLIELRKDVRQSLDGTSDYKLPEIYKVDIDRGGKSNPAGRFMIANNKVHHLEDYHNLLDSVIPAGEVDSSTLTQLLNKVHGGGISISDATKGHSNPEPTTMQRQALIPTVVKMDNLEQPPVFSYFRPGMAKPHVVEFGQFGAALDGNELNEDELNLMLENAQKGLALIKWGTSGTLQKSIDDLDDLTSLDETIQHIRQQEAAGLVKPGSSAILTKHAYEDPMVGGIGNKYASTMFRMKNKPGVYASIDMNDFKHINDNHGHDAGDEAIKSVGGALREASRKVGTTKIFRPGGDEFMCWAPTHEHMNHFLRHAREHIDKLPPVAGVHKQSMSVGIGHDFTNADKALYIAKQGKHDPVTGQRLHAVGQVPNLGYSLYQGHEGPLFKENLAPSKMAVAS